MQCMNGPDRLLWSNGRPIRFDDTRFVPMAEVPQLASSQQMRDALLADGYLLLRELLPREDVLALRADYFGRYPRGAFVDDSAPGDGRFRAGYPEGRHGIVGHPAHAFVRSGLFAEFVGGDGPLRKTARAILGPGCHLVQRSIVREFRPGVERSTAAHVDAAYMSNTQANSVTLWAPLGDCPLEGGALIYLERSHVERDLVEALEREPERPADRRRLSYDLDIVVERTGLRWLWADLRAGDVLVHSPAIVHASLCVSGSLAATRLSADVRYVTEHEPLDPRWTVDWSGDDGI